MTVLFDSWAWVEYFRNGEKAKDVVAYLEKDIDIYISAITVAEVFRFLLHHETRQTAEKLTRWMMQRSHVIVLTSKIAWSAAEYKHKYKWGLGDATVYATARSKGIDIVTGDADFKEVPNVIYFGK